MDFSTLPDGTIQHVNPALLLDFSHGNKRKKRPTKTQNDMRQSIKDNGVLQNVGARPHPDKPGYLELLFGYGRRDICLEESIDSIPVNIKQVDDREAYIIHLQENTIRSDMTVVDEARAAQEFSTLFGGDRQAIANQLCWPLKKVNERLELMKCTNKVLSSLEDEKISVAHAMAIAPFSPEGQDKLIDTVLNRGWTVKELKLQIGSAQTPLSKAKFDTKDCQTCEHNTYHQMGLLDDVSSEAKCSRISCFREKSAQWLNSIRESAQERYGKILFLSESAQKDRNTVSADEVGNEQFEKGCTSCEKRIAIMSDATGHEGQITENQCIDTVCFTKCTKVLAGEIEKALALPEVQAEAKANPEKAKSLAKTKAKTSAKQAETGAMSNVAVSHHKALLRQASAEHFAKNQTVRAAFMLAAMIGATGFSGNETHKFTLSFDQNVLYASQKMTVAEMQQCMLQAIEYGMTEASSLDNRDATNLMINLLKTDTEHAEQVAINKWEASSANLNIYTTSQLDQLARDASVNTTLDAKEKGAYGKATKGKKADFISTLVECGHDYASFAPSWYLKHVKS